MTNATRAGPEGHAALPVRIACKNPDTMLRSPVGTSHNTDSVPRMYATAMSGAEITIERGRSRFGFAVSSPMVDESSSPANANAIDAHRLSVDRSVTSGRSAAAENAFALG